MAIESCKKWLNLLIPVILLLPYFSISKVFYDDEWDGFDAKSKEWCIRLKKCTPDNRTVCGWDEDASFLGQFENLCILYRANCRGAGMYVEVDWVICETRKNFSLAHPDGEATEFEWIHIEQGTSAASTTADLSLHANETALRHQTKFITMYPEGGTLPPNFFANDQETHSNKTTAKRRKKPSEAELNGRVLDLLWRKSAGKALDSADKLSDNITNKTN